MILCQFREFNPLSKEGHLQFVSLLSMAPVLFTGVSSKHVLHLRVLE